MRFAVFATLAAVTLLAPGASPAGDGRPPRPQPLCALPTGAASLPASARRGLIEHLSQYPSLARTTPAERAAARGLLGELRRATARWRVAGRARAGGYALHRANREPSDVRPHYLHAEHRRFSGDRRFLDPRRPEVLIYANVPGRRLALVGVMFSVPRGVRGRSPGGALTRWHRHLVCARGAKRGLEPRADGSCPPGARLREGSEMMHVWFTRDLRSAFAVRAPEPELCAAGLLPGAHCASGRRGVGM